MGRRVTVGIGVAVAILFLVAGIAFCFRVIHAAETAAAEPVTQSRLVALVSGNALPEDVAARIQNFGLAFTPDPAYHRLLQSAGADPRILTALDTAKVSQNATSSAPLDRASLQRLADAGPLLAQKKYEDAASAVSDAMAKGVPESDCGFVMGEILRQREDFPQARAVYAKLSEESRNFPEAQVKLSYVMYRFDDSEEALRLAKAALASGAGGAEAHKNAGLALEAMRKIDASTAEYNEALRLKPDYMSVWLDMGNLNRDQGRLNDAVENYKHAIALSPDENLAHYNLGVAYGDLGQPDNAIHEYREAKRLNPANLAARENLAMELLHRNSIQEAVAEFQELAAMNPGSALCHDCYGTALFDARDFDGAETEWTYAEKIDASDGRPHLGIGAIREEQKRYDEAVAEYRTATKLDPTLADPYAGAGRVLIAQHKFAEAAQVLREGLTRRPDGAPLHELLAQALAGAGGEFSSAIGEDRASLALDPKNVQTMLHLAADYERNGDWVNALEEYKQAARIDSAQDTRGKIIRTDQLNAEREFESAQKRWDANLASLRANGKSNDADALVAKLKTATETPALSQQLDEAMKAGADADQVRNFSAALADYQRAVELADKLQPDDQRLITSLDKLGNNAMGQDNVAAQAAYEREYKAACERNGPDSGSAEQALQSLARLETFTHNYASAERHYFRAVEIANHTFGEGSMESAKAILTASGVYLARKDYLKAEPYILRAERSEEAILGSDSPDLVTPLSQECYLYDQWGKSKETDACDQHLLAILQKQYGKDTPFTVPILASDAKALRALGRRSDADAVERRVAVIRASTIKPN
jgi:tetratricopeptide (TPR) repeat protein